MIYLASPYSSPLLTVRSFRFLQARDAAAALLRAGRLVYSPIVHGHAIASAHYDLPTDHDFWMRHCFDMLARCDDLMVLQLTGWRESKGVQAEIRWWRDRRDKEPVFVWLEGLTNL